MMPPCMDATPKRLPAQAEVLLNVLKSYLGKNQCCWPKQKTLARDLHMSVRQVQQWIAYLRDAGEIEVERPSRLKGNRYYIPPRSDARKTAPPDTRFSAPPDTKESAPPDARKSAPLTVDESLIMEGGISEPKTSPSPVSQIQEKPEHPETLLHLELNHKIDAHPRKAWIVAEVRKEFPLLFANAPDNDYDFRRACIELMQALEKDRPFLRFKEAFVRRAPGCPQVPEKQGFIDDWEPAFDRISATLEEMLKALDAFVYDPRHDIPKWGFARDAGRHILKNIKAQRKLAKVTAHKPPAEVKPRDSPAQTSAAPLHDHDRLIDVGLLKVGRITQDEFDRRERARSNPPEGTEVWK